jgi:hypothetical protein
MAILTPNGITLNSRRRSTTQMKRPTRVTRILQAQERAAVAHALLLSLPVTDPRFPDAVNDYTDACIARLAVEQEGITQ